MEERKATLSTSEAEDSDEWRRWWQYAEEDLTAAQRVLEVEGLAPRNRESRMTIGEIIEQGFHYARTCRSLWLFGFFVGIASGGSNGSR